MVVGGAVGNLGGESPLPEAGGLIQSNTLIKWSKYGNKSTTVLFR